ncbi:hypothetical protein STEG23_015174 [Scotinomys teguina]
MHKRLSNNSTCYEGNTKGRLLQQPGLLLSISTFLPDGADSVRTVDSGDPALTITLETHFLLYSSHFGSKKRVPYEA